MPSLYGLILVAAGLTCLLIALHGAKGLEITLPPGQQSPSEWLPKGVAVQPAATSQSWPPKGVQ